MRPRTRTPGNTCLYTLQKLFKMRHICVLLLLAFGLSACLADSCFTYERESYKVCTETRVKCYTAYRNVKKCCTGYCGDNCECSHLCYVTRTYKTWRCVDDLELDCFPTKKRSTEAVCCDENNPAAKKCPLS